MYTAFPDIKGIHLKYFILYATNASNPAFSMLIQYLLSFNLITSNFELFLFIERFIIFLREKYLLTCFEKSFPVPHGSTTISEFVSMIPDTISFSVPSPPTL